MIVRERTGLDAYAGGLLSDLCLKFLSVLLVLLLEGSPKCNPDPDTSISMEKCREAHG